MYLIELSLYNFRCFENFKLDDLNKLAIWIGENDAGKTVLLEAIALLSGNQSCSTDDFLKTPSGAKADEVVLEGVFQVEPHDTLTAEYKSGMGKELFLLKKRFTSTSSEIYVVGQGDTGGRFNDFTGAEQQKTLLKEYGITPATREPERKAQRDELVRSGKLSHRETEVKIGQFSVLAAFMPRVIRVASTDYITPESLIQQTLRVVAASVMSPPDPKSGIPKEVENLVDLRQRIEERVNEEIQKAKATLQRTHPKLRDIRVSPLIDFARSVTLNYHPKTGHRLSLQNRPMGRSRDEPVFTSLAPV